MADSLWLYSYFSGLTVFGQCVMSDYTMLVNTCGRLSLALFLFQLPDRLWSLCVMSDYTTLVNICGRLTVAVFLFQWPDCLWSVCVMSDYSMLVNTCGRLTVALFLFQWPDRLWSVCDVCLHYVGKHLWQTDSGAVLISVAWQTLVSVWCLTTLHW